jgi:hypothetical protein
MNTLTYTLEITLFTPIPITNPSINTDLLQLALLQKGLNTSVRLTEIKNGDGDLIFLGSPSNNQNNYTPQAQNEQIKVIK